MRSARLPAALALAAALLAGPAGAATFQRIDLPGAAGTGILMSGIVNQGDEAAFRALAATLPSAVVLTTGPGGNFRTAIAIGTEIRNRGWATLVPEGATCASACAMIWLAGARRLLAEGGRIGFHAIGVRVKDTVTETHEADGELRRWLTALGYSDDTTATIVNTPQRLVRWLDRLELQANGIAAEPYP